jgi:uncharacterized membrane protein YphA (DoxX/SURF4 family)
VAPVRFAAIVRIATGLLFLAEGYSKIAGEFVKGGFRKQAALMAHEAFPFWRRFLETAVIPHASAVAWAFASAELVVGIALVLGLLTRAACAVGIALMLSILLASANAGSGARWADWITAGLTPKFALLLFVLLLAVNAGTTWGLDARLWRKGSFRPAR